MWHNKQNYNIKQWDTDTIHAVFLVNYQKNPSTTILKHVNILDKVNISPYVILIDMMLRYVH